MKKETELPKKSKDKRHLINSIIQKFGKNSDKPPKTNKLLKKEVIDIVALKRKKEFEDRHGLNIYQIGKKNYS